MPKIVLGQKRIFQFHCAFLKSFNFILVHLETDRGDFAIFASLFIIVVFGIYLLVKCGNIIWHQIFRLSSC